MKKPPQIPDIDGPKIADLARNMAISLRAHHPDNYIDLGFVTDNTGKRAKLRLSLVPAHNQERISELFNCVRGPK